MQISFGSKYGVFLTSKEIGKVCELTKAQSPFSKEPPGSNGTLDFVIEANGTPISTHSARMAYHIYTQKDALEITSTAPLADSFKGRAADARKRPSDHSFSFVEFTPQDDSDEALTKAMQALLDDIFEKDGE